MLKELADRSHGRAPKPNGLDDYSFISLSEIFDFIWRYRMSIGVITALPLLLAIFYVATTAPSYTASAHILLDPNTPETMRPNITSGSSFDSPYIESQVALLKSENLALKVIDANGLMSDPEFLGSLPPAEDAANVGEQFLRKREVMYAFSDGLDVRRVGLSYAILVSFTSTDPDKAARIANSVSQAFIRDELESRAATLRTGSKWLEERIDQLRQKMNEAALSVQRFKVRRDYSILATKRAANGGGNTESPSEDAIAKPRKTLEELEATLQTYRRIYESYLQAYTEALQRQSFPVVNARIITPATRPLAPSAPKKKLILALSLFVGLLLAFSQALVRYHFEDLTGR